MAVLLAKRPALTDPLSEEYFSKAAGALHTHRTGPGHACVSCATSWPCRPALAAAFMLELHTS